MIIMILRAQFVPKVLWLGAFTSAIISGIIVAGIAGLLLWDARVQTIWPLLPLAP